MHQPDVAPAATATRHAWYVVAVLLLLNVSSFIDRQVMALMVTPIKADLGLTDTQMGLLPRSRVRRHVCHLGNPARSTGGPGQSHRDHRLGRRSVECDVHGSGVANTFGQLFAARFGVGIGEATLSPSANSLIADYFPPEKLATALSVFTSGVFIGSGLAYFIGGTVIETVSNLEPWRLPVFGEIRAWQRVFIVVGIPGLLLALLALTIREPRRSRPAGSPVHAATTSEVVSWLRRHARAYLTFGIGIAIYSTVNFGTAFWFPAFLSDRTAGVRGSRPVDGRCHGDLWCGGRHRRRASGGLLQGPRQEGWKPHCPDDFGRVLHPGRSAALPH
jgi:hypothetical protein